MNKYGALDTQLVGRLTGWGHSIRTEGGKYGTKRFC